MIRLISGLLDSIKSVISYTDGENESLKKCLNKQRILGKWNNLLKFKMTKLTDTIIEFYLKNF